MYPRLTQDIAYIYEILLCNHICSGIAENGEVVAVQDFLDVANILGKSCIALCQGCAVWLAFLVDCVNALAWCSQ